MVQIIETTTHADGTTKVRTSRRDWKREYGLPPGRGRGEVALRYDNEEFYGPCIVLYRDHDTVRVGWIIPFKPPWQGWAKPIFRDHTCYVAMLCDGQSWCFRVLQDAEDWLILQVEALVARLNAVPAPEGEQ